jgi:sulfite reductase (NADPH) flavoprotein alpha-component
MLSHLGNIQPLKTEQLAKLNEVLSQLNAEQRIWLSGFLAGQSVSGSNLTTETPASSTQAATQLTVLYGSQTGNARSLAENFQAAATIHGLKVKLTSLADYNPRQLLKERHVVILVSTHGEGDPPDDAEILHEFLFANKSPDLSQLSYAVLALGDSSYEQFCQTGIEFDQQLEKLGASRLVDRVDCDLDFAQDAERWQQLAIEKLTEVVKPTTNSNVVPLADYQQSSNETYSRQNPFKAEIITLQKLTTVDSIKNIFHLELSLEGSGINYSPGDSLAVIVNNPVNHVQALIEQLGLDATTNVQIQGETLTLQQALIEQKEISLLNRKFLRYLTEQTDNTALLDTINSQTKFEQFVASRQLIDVIKKYPIEMTAQQLIDQLPGITPRSYSIASSLQASSDEVHLTVALVETQENRTGLVSGELCQHAEVGDFVQVYVEPNNHFKLPETPETPIIMIGPGTGVAPFRGFLQEREALGHVGKNWLFFGNPSFADDFLYQLEWQKYIKSGLLNKIDLAFSRDQSEKIYVQHRLLEQATEIWQWLDRGAHIYLCGDKSRMAKDVEQTLLEIIQQQGHKTEQQAVDLLKDLKRAKRYQKDVY